jgi:DNA-binding NtrC family response regulator
MMNVLHLDDDTLFLHRCSISFKTSPHVAHITYSTANSAEEFKSKLESIQPQGVLLDLSFGGKALKGLEVLRAIREQGYQGSVMVMSALSTSDIILECMRAGANDFLSKGIDESELTFRVSRLLQNVNPQLPLRGTTRNLPAYVTGRAMRDIQQRLARVLNSSVRALLVSGESGSGKEMVADTLRSLLPVGSPFISINCAALATNLIEGEIFGHEKGAFTGATQSKIGLYEAADGGWFFLDEVARLSLPAQASLLRALENGEVRPVGGTRSKKVNVKVIAATNESLDKMVELGEFRADLLSRLRGYEIGLPPLRARSHLERQEIVEALLDRLNATVHVDGKEYRITNSCMAVLCDLPWDQGNIRELWQTILAMSVDASDGVLSLESLPPRLLRRKKEESQSGQIIQVANETQNSSTTESLPEGLRPILTPVFPLHFENMVDSLFEHLLNSLRRIAGEEFPSQRVVAQMFTMTRHEATQRMARSGKAAQ